MRSLSIQRHGLPGLVLVLAAGTAQANALGKCEDVLQHPTAQRAACDVAIEAANDPVERAQLLVLRAGTWARALDKSGIDDALADLAEAERLAPEADPQLRADLLVVRASAHHAQGDDEAAQAETEEAARLAPNDADPVINRGVLLADQDDLDGALAQFARALELEPKHLEAHVVATYYLYEAQQFDACVERGNKAVELAPEDPRVWAARGLCLAELGRTEEALADIHEAERLEPYTMVTHQDITTGYLVLERPDEALAAAQRGVEFDPENEGAWSSLLRALVAKGETNEAIAVYREALATGIEDTTGEMANALAWTLYVEGHPEEALPIIEEGLGKQTEPEAYSVDTHAHILAALGRADEAVQAFLRAAELSPEELRGMYEEGLAGLGHAAEPGDEGFEAALRACVATGPACRLFPE